jgi:Divergent InlB B-repeat domain
MPTVGLVLLLFGWASVAQAQQLTLSWTDTSHETASFVIQRGPATTGPWDVLASTSIGDTDYVDQAVVWETPYCYRVAAQSSTGVLSAWSNIACGTAHASPTTASLSVMKTGSGTVTSSPAGITCGSVCSKTFAMGARVSLTATPALGYKFTGWAGAGGCSGKGVCKITITKPDTLWAYFRTQP